MAGAGKSIPAEQENVASPDSWAVSACRSRFEFVERNQSRVYFTPYAPAVRTPVPGVMANPMRWREKQTETAVYRGENE